MMIGHLTIAGMAEMMVTAGLVAWLQKSHLSLLSVPSGWRATRPLLAGLTVLMLLTPLGILAVGTAWGEWAPSQLSVVPAGLARLSSIWTAPFPDYAPPLLRSPWLGYLLSGAFGIGLILFTALVVDWALAWRRRRAQ
jgi:cobalt/nickel transport system permease protein